MRLKTKYTKKVKKRGRMDGDECQVKGLLGFS